MSLFTTIGRMAADYRTRRHLRRTYAELMSLPAHVQKDIGWPDAFQTSVPAQRFRDF